ncbi:MAG: biosynthetic-type acetolactate synthase large subunit [Chrysiogenetes bacterium]|nr:biosynthetic-type acetolactate synthase large subunit [Chrysiogenetes bacterium]
MEMTGAEIFCESLTREGVDTFFGYPGGAVLHIYDEIYKRKMNHVLTRHEQGAVHMADGYARASGKVGVALVTSGPGATNAVTGLATAYMDSIPMVCFTGQVPSTLIGNDAFQEADTLGITRPVTKHNFMVTDVKDLARIIREAFYIASTGRPGPVVVDIPKDITADKCKFHWPESVDIPSYKPTVQGHMKQVKKAMDRLLRAKKPVLYVGGGVILSNGAEELSKFARALNIPVTQTLMGLGCFPMGAPLSLDMLGMHGTYRANMAMSNADVIMAVGVRFDDRVTGKLEKFAVHADFIHVDVDPASISKNVEIQIPIVGDARVVLEQFNEVLPDSKKTEAFHKQIAPWHEQIAKWEATHPLAYTHNETGAIKPQFMIEELQRLTKDRDPIVVADVGQHQMWAAQYFKFQKPRKWLNSGGLGTMGFSLPAAIGAQFACPDDLVLCIAGDGCIQMCIQELIVAAEYKLPIKIFIANNSCLGMVRQWQEFFYEKRYSEVLWQKEPEWVKLAEAFGAIGFDVDKVENFEKVAEEALASPQPAMVNVRVTQDENVYPMVPAGGALDEMLVFEPPA